MQPSSFLVSLVVLASGQQGLGAAAPPEALDVPFVPTPPDVVETMLEMARVKKGDVVYDLGSGDGRVVIAAAKQYGARGVGVDLDPQRIAEARTSSRRAGVANRVEFRQGDLFQIDLRKASVLTLYLLPDVNMRLRPRLIEQLRPGTRVVSHNYDLGDWRPDATRTVGDSHRVYLWVVPAQVGGGWRWEQPAGAGQYLLDVDQHFQQLRARLARADRAGVPGESHTVANNFRDPASRAPDGKTTTVTVVDPKVVGDHLSFTTTETHAGRPVTIQYRGTVSAGAITGTATILAGRSITELPWTATRSGKDPSGR